MLTTLSMLGAVLPTVTVADSGLPVASPSAGVTVQVAVVKRWSLAHLGQRTTPHR